MPFEIPVSWKWCKVDDFAYVASGSTPDKSAFVEKGIPYLKMYNLKNQKIDFDFKPQYIKEEVHNGKLQRSRTEVGDLIMNIVGPPLGKLAIIPSSLPQCNFNQAAVLIRPIVHKEIIVNFLYYYLSEMSEINSLQTRGNAGQDNISLTQCMGVHVPMPPLNEQKRIVAEIEKWFALINDLETDKQELQEAIKKSKMKILDLAIHGKLVEQDPNDEPASELLKHIAPNAALCDNSHYENTPFEVPQNWVWVRIKDIAISELGKTLDRGKNSGKPYDYLCALNVKWNAFDLTTVKQILLEDNERERYLVRRGDLLICEGGDVGRAAIWENDEEIYYQNALHRVRFKGNINQYFYLYVLQYYKIIGLIDDVSGGVTIKHFTQNSMKKLLFPLPPLAEQKRIVSKVSELLNLLDKITTEL